MKSLKYASIICILFFTCGMARADCTICYSLEEALQSKERVESLELLDSIQPSLSGLRRLESLQSLYINLKGTSSFPDEILVLPNLELLIIEGNAQLSVDEIACRLQVLPKLRRLYLISFYCPTIPESVLQLTELTQLGISNSRVREVPTDIAKLSNLNYLKLVDNEIRSLPKEVGQLQRLHVLNIQYNNIENIPEGMDKLEKIYFIQITGNPLTAEAKEYIKTSKIDYIYVEDDPGSYQWIEPEER